jgi:hypothetical protein
MSDACGGVLQGLGEIRRSDSSISQQIAMSDPVTELLYFTPAALILYGEMAVAHLAVHARQCNFLMPARNRPGCSLQLLSQRCETSNRYI